mgnify:CR=1
MADEATTLLARDESSGRSYPMFIERLLFLGAIVGFFFLQPIVMETVDSPTWLAAISGWCVLPLVLMLSTELVGRILQRTLSD